jgi:hypothetical protein
VFLSRMPQLCLAEPRAMLLAQLPKAGEDPLLERVALGYQVAEGRADQDAKGLTRQARGSPRHAATGRQSASMTNGFSLTTLPQ